jgi:hypothetical protein
MTLLRQERNMGTSAATNTGWARARGEYVAHHDCDDISLPERLARQVAFLDQHRDVGMVGTWFQLTNAHGELISDVYQLPAAPYLIAWYLYFYNPVAHSSVMMRRQVVREAGGYIQTREPAQDYSLWCRLLGRTKLSVVQSLLLYLRKHDSNLSLLRDDEVTKSCTSTLRERIEAKLGRHIPESLARALWTRQYPNALVAVRVAALIYSLAQKELANPNRLVAERSVIRGDAAERVGKIFRQMPSSTLSWGHWCALLWLARMDPALAKVERAGWLAKGPTAK